MGARDLVTEGGVLIYSTCTFNEEENDNNIQWLCQQGGFEAVELTVVPAWGLTKTAFGYQCYPHLVKGEGFFLSVMRRTSAVAKTKTKLKPTESAVPLAKKDRELIEPWIAEHERFSFFQKPNNEIVAVPNELKENYALVSGALKRRSSGLVIGSLKQRNFIPSHALALSEIIDPDLPGVSLEKEQALHYLRKDDIEISHPGKGWHLVRFEGFNLGWVKLLGNRYNNYLPNEWRIRMDIDKP